MNLGDGHNSMHCMYLKGVESFVLGTFSQLDSCSYSCLRKKDASVRDGVPAICHLPNYKRGGGEGEGRKRRDKPTVLVHGPAGIGEDKRNTACILEC